MFMFYKNYEQENQKKVVASAVLGVAAGVVTALFLSPIRGSQARKIVANKARSVAQNIEDRFSDAVDNVKDGIKDVSDGIKDKTDDVRDIVNRDARRVRGKVSEGLSDAANNVSPESK
jgi:gas vesicle protein